MEISPKKQSQRDNGEQHSFDFPTILKSGINYKDCLFLTSF